MSRPPRPTYNPARPSRTVIPTESAEQIALFAWAAYEAGAHPALRLLHHIPNGGYRTPSEAARFTREGVRSGIPDICLPVARGVYHGLYIELKRSKGGKLSEAQAQWLENLREQGYYAVRCDGADAAIREILGYLGEEAHDETN